MNTYEYTADRWIEAFGIFKKYESGVIEVSAEHDVLYVGVDPDKVSETDAARLDELGWHKEESYGCYAKFV